VEVGAEEDMEDSSVEVVGIASRGSQHTPLNLKATARAKTSIRADKPAIGLRDQEIRGGVVLEVLHPQLLPTLAIWHTVEATQDMAVEAGMDHIEVLSHTESGI